MSASLVGSEMCIRDRARTRLDMPVISSSPTCARCQALLKPLGLHAHSVSYTHLTLPTICSV
eukprot:10870833-Alexandrium_andersonii.AAC.1